MPAPSSRWRRRCTLSPGAVQAQSLLGWAQMLHEDYDDALGTFSKVLMKEPANALARINVGYICLKKRIFGEAIEHLSKAIRLDNDRKATLYAHYYLGLVYLEREMYEDAQTFLPEDAQARAQSDRGLLRAGPRALVRAASARRRCRPGPTGYKANKFNPWAKRCQEMLDVAAAGARSRAARSPIVASLGFPLPAGRPAPAARCPGRAGHGRRLARPASLAIDLAGEAARPADWPGLGRRDPGPLRLIVVPDGRLLDSLASGRAPPGAPPWPCRARAPSSCAPTRTISPHAPPRARAPRAARGGARAGPALVRRGLCRLGRGRVGAPGRLELNLAVVRGAIPTLAALDGALRGSASTADAAYALAASAVTELARRNPTGTLTPLLQRL